MTTQSSAAKDRIAILELELHRRKQRFQIHGEINGRDHDASLHANPAFRDRIKQIERLALRYAPLQGPDVDHLFSEIEYVKDVLDGTVPPPKPKRTKSKRKKV